MSSSDGDDRTKAIGAPGRPTAGDGEDTRATAPQGTPAGPPAGGSTAATDPTAATVVPSSSVPSVSDSTATAMRTGSSSALAPTLFSAPTRGPGSFRGQVWGDFEIGELLGKGGMGEVYRGRQLSLDRPVAIKVLSEQLSGSGDFRKRFLLEARAAAKLSTPHVVQVYFAGEHAGRHYFAMEYVEGTDLAQKLKDGWRPGRGEALDLMVQAARSLVALGEHKIVHRDIKPANYMITGAGRLKLMDFGLAKFASEQHGLTQTGMVMGTVNYFSPEQGRGEVCDQRTDIYALGVMFYELLTGKLPFTGGNPTSIIYQHIHVAPQPPQQINPDVPEPYQSVVLRCLEKDPKARYATAVDLLADLERIQRGEKPLAGEPRTAVTVAMPGAGAAVGDGATTSATPARWPWLIAAAALVLAVVAVWPRVSPASAPTSAPAPSASAPAPAQATPPPPAALVPAPVVETPKPKPAPLVAKTDPPPPVVVKVEPPPPPPVPKPEPVAPKPEPVVVKAEPVVAKPEPKPEPIPVPPPIVIAKAEPPPVPSAPKPEPVPEPAPVIAKIVPPPAPAPEPAKPTPPPVVETPPAPVVAVKPPPAPDPIKPVPPPTPPTPKAPSGPMPVLAPVGTTVTVRVPAGDALAKSSGFLWWLSGPPGLSGRLSARSTTRPEIEWTAPGLPGDVVLHVAATSGGERTLNLPLRAVADDQAKRQLVPFLRYAGVAERRLHRLARDGDGSWWGVDSGEGIVVHIADGWQLEARFIPVQPVARPLAAVPANGRIHLLDADQRAIVICQSDGTVLRTIPGLDRPLDLAVGRDGTIFVAEQRQGVAVFAPDGKRSRTLVRSGQNGFDRLTRIAVSGDGALLALDAGAKAVAVFTTATTPAATWALDPASRPVALAVRGQSAFVAVEDGRVLVLDTTGRTERVLPAPPSDEGLGVASDLVADLTGEILVTHPSPGNVVRHAAGGLAWRGAIDWNRPGAVDGDGRLYLLDPSRLRVDVLDGEGFTTRRLGGPPKKGGTLSEPIALAVDPEGRSLAVLDSDTRQVTRFDLATGTAVVFGGPGKTDGQFDTPLAVAMDAAGRTYVLDSGLHRVCIFDAAGRFLSAFGRYERGDAADLLRAPRRLAVSPTGDQCIVSDDETCELKRFLLDHQRRRADHAGNLGGRGQGPGQLLRVAGLGIDRRGLVYALDVKRLDLQIFSGRGLQQGLRLDTIDLHRLRGMTVAPDGQLLIQADGMLSGLRW